MLGLLFLVIGGLLLVVDNVAAYVALGIGVTLLLLVPGAAAFMGAERQFRPDHKVEGRTFVVDLWRSVVSARSDRWRSQP